MKHFQRGAVLSSIVFVCATFSGCSSEPQKAAELPTPVPRAISGPTANAAVEANWSQLKKGMSVQQAESLLGPLQKVAFAFAMSGSGDGSNDSSALMAATLSFVAGTKAPTEGVTLETYTCQAKACSLAFCRDSLAQWARDMSLVDADALMKNNVCSVHQEGRGKRKKAKG
jgi:hypothetical protein